MEPRHDKKKPREPGTLYVVATPIGNMEDLTDRARRILSEVDLVAAEDTRTVGLFLSRLGIRNRLLSYFEGNESRRTPGLVERLRAGEDIALVCEAGTPTISDPGSILVTAALEAGLPVVPVPGPSAAVAALSASGLPTDHFYFEGFLPKPRAKKRRRLTELSRIDATLIFYESPKRTAATLAAMAEILGPDRRAVVARELTKLHEEFLRADLSELAARAAQEPLRGEVVILVEGAARQTATDRLGGPELDRAIEAGLEAGHSPGHIARDLALRTGVPRRLVYQRALELESQRGDPEAESESDSNSESNARLVRESGSRTDSGPETDSSPEPDSGPESGPESD